MPTSRLVALHGDEADLYREHHRALRRAVARRVRMSADLVEEACQHAWLQLIRCQPDRGPSLHGWLTTVAVREGYRLSAIERRTRSLDAPATAGDSTMSLLEAVPAPGDVLEQALEARRALRAVAGLPDRQRRYLMLHLGGCSYAEIADREHATFTNVNKHLVRARRRLRVAADQAA